MLLNYISNILLKLIQNTFTEQVYISHTVNSVRKQFVCQYSYGGAGKLRCHVLKNCSLRCETFDIRQKFLRPIYSGDNGTNKFVQLSELYTHFMARFKLKRFLLWLHSKAFYEFPCLSVKSFFWLIRTERAFQT